MKSLHIFFNEQGLSYRLGYLVIVMMMMLTKGGWGYRLLAWLDVFCGLQARIRLLSFTLSFVIRRETLKIGWLLALNLDLPLIDNLFIRIRSFAQMYKWKHWQQNDCIICVQCALHTAHVMSSNWKRQTYLMSATNTLFSIFRQIHLVIVTNTIWICY